MKVERIVAALFVAALIALASSIYYAYGNFTNGVASGAIARHSHTVIDSVYQLEYEATQVEKASDKFTLHHEPDYGIEARQYAVILNNSIQSLLDSVKANPTQLQRATELEGLITSMEKNMPALDSLNLTHEEAEPKLFGTPTYSNNYLNKIIAKSHEIITQELLLLSQRRNISLQARRNTINALYYTAISAFLFIFLILIALNRSLRKRRIAENRIRENEEKLRLLFEEVGDVIYSASYDGKFTFINNRLERLTGYTTDELLGKHFTFLLPPDWTEKVKEFYYEQFKNKVYETRLEFPIITKQGTTKWVEQNVVLVSKDDKVESFQCVVRDITQRKNAEDEIQRTNRFLDSVLENIPNMIFIKDADDLRFMRLNKAGEKLLGYKQQDLLGKNDYDFFPKEQADFFTKKDRKVLTENTGLDIPEEPIKTTDGTRWLHTKKIPVTDPAGKPLYLLGISEDITERKKDEDTIIELNKNLARYVAELEESQRFYKTIARNFPDGTIAVLDRNLNYIFVDGRELATEGLYAEELTATPYLNRYPEELKEEIKNNLLKILKGDSVEFETQLSGNYYMMHGVPLGKAGDEIMLVKQNITKLKQAEENMKIALDKEKMINELKSRFVSLASHEFRTPLSTILSSTELIGEYIQHDEENPAIIKEKNTKHLGRIKNSVQNMVNILNNFLSLDQLEQGKTLTNAVRFNAQTFAMEIVEEFSPKLKHGQKILYTHQSKSTDVYIDKLILKNIVTNLIGNAIKYSPENSIINYTSNVTEAGLEFTVEDHGIGIPQNEQSNLFERFFRAKNTLNIEGTGLGLSIVKKYIDLLNGQIAFTSQENIGSTFRIFIPNESGKRATETLIKGEYIG